jgi:hypothetical protein
MGEMSRDASEKKGATLRSENYTTVAGLTKKEALGSRLAPRGE